jgi:hypothetical protein
MARYKGRGRFIAWPDHQKLEPAQRETVTKGRDADRPRCVLCLVTEEEPARYAVFLEYGWRPLCAWCAVGQWAIEQGLKVRQRKPRRKRKRR